MHDCSDMRPWIRPTIPTSAYTCPNMLACNQHIWMNQCNHRPRCSAALLSTNPAKNHQRMAHLLIGDCTWKNALGPCVHDVHKLRHLDG